MPLRALHVNQTKKYPPLSWSMPNDKSADEAQKWKLATSTTLFGTSVVGSIGAIGCFYGLGNTELTMMLLC